MCYTSLLPLQSDGVSYFMFLFMILGFASNQSSSGEVSIKLLKWQTDMQHSIFRKLINETHGKNFCFFTIDF